MRIPFYFPRDHHNKLKKLLIPNKNGISYDVKIRFTTWRDANNIKRKFQLYLINRDDLTVLT